MSRIQRHVADRNGLACHAHPRVFGFRAMQMDHIAADHPHGAAFALADAAADPVPALRALAGDVRLPGSRARS